MLEGQKEEQLMAGVVLQAYTGQVQFPFSEEPINQVSERENKQVRVFGYWGMLCKYFKCCFFFLILYPFQAHHLGTIIYVALPGSSLTNDIQIDWAPLVEMCQKLALRLP